MFSGKLIISMVIFNSYAKLPEGNGFEPCNILGKNWNMYILYTYIHIYIYTYNIYTPAYRSVNILKCRNHVKSKPTEIDGWKLWFMS